MDMELSSIFVRHTGGEWLRYPIQWRHNERDGVSNHRRLDCSGSHQIKHQISASLAFVRGIHRWPVNSPHKGPVTRKMFPFDDVIMPAPPLQLGRDPTWRPVFLPGIVLAAMTLMAVCRGIDGYQRPAPVSWWDGRSWGWSVWRMVSGTPAIM